MATSAPVDNGVLRLWSARWQFPYGVESIDITPAGAVAALGKMGLTISSAQSSQLSEAECARWDEFDGWTATQRARLEAHFRDRAVERAGFIEQWRAIGAFLRAHAPVSCVLDIQETRDDLTAGGVLIVARAEAEDVIYDLFQTLNVHELDLLAQGHAGFEVEEIEASARASIVECVRRTFSTLENGARFNRAERGFPAVGESDAEYLARVAVDGVALMDFCTKLRPFGGLSGHVVAEKAWAQRTKPTRRVEYLVEGLLPRANLSLLVGAPKIGKSTLALQIAIAVASEQDLFGLPVAKSEGLVLFVSGEDSEEVVCTRVDSLLAGAPDPKRFFLSSGAGSIRDILKDFETVPVDLIVIDTAARFVEGSVSDGAHVRAFVGCVDAFAKQKNAAAVILHHVNKPSKKGGPPKSGKAVLAQMKGSGEFHSAARVFLAMFEAAGNARVLDVASSNMPSAAPTIKEPIRLVYDPTTERHEVVAVEVAQESELTAQAVPAQDRPKAKYLDDDAATVAPIVIAALAAGRAVARTGVNEPYTWRAPELAGWPRTKIRAAHRRAVELGLLASPTAQSRAAE